MGCASSTNASSDASIHERYSFQATLGQGAFGQVRACEQRDTKLQCAVKIIDVTSGSHIPFGTPLSLIELEGSMWKKVGSHPNVVKLMETYYTDGPFCYFIMEKCQTSLFDMLLEKKGNLPEVKLLESFEQMLFGLQHCHSKFVIHRDVKPANFLVGVDGAIKLCDFGLAIRERVMGVRGASGTAPFMSPEMVMNKPYDRKTDVWSLGATAYLMLYGEYPYNVTNQKKHIAEGRNIGEVMQETIALNANPPTYKAVKGCDPSPLARTFVEALLVREAAHRPLAPECLELPAMKVAALSLQTEEHVDVGGAVEVARERSKEFRASVDPTVQKTRDELIEKLQAQFGGPSFLRSFSLPTPDTISTTLPAMLDPSEETGDKLMLCTRKSSKSSTHTGSTTFSTATWRSLPDSPTSSGSGKITL